jgi:hypothetical protein
MAQHFDFPAAYFGSTTDTVADLVTLTDIGSRHVRVDQIITAAYDETD